MNLDMELEVEIPEFLELLKLAHSVCSDDLLKGIILYNPSLDEEYTNITIDNGSAKFTDLAGRSRSVPFSAMGQWSAIIPGESVLNSPELQQQTDAGRRAVLVSQLNQLGLTSGQTLAVNDLQAIIDAWNIPLFRTTLDFRRGVYQSIKKLENEPGMVSASYRLGFKVMERWLTQPLTACPTDYLIQLAYYRRWTKQTDAALEVTALIERQDASVMFSKYETAILATERAAAFMDKFEKSGFGIDKALRFLRYHHRLLGGRSDEHNANAWKRYHALTGTNTHGKT